MAGNDDITQDAVLGGRLTLRQPRRGHRVGHDAMLLAAATEARAGEQAIDLGAGAGSAGLALARRVPGLGVTLVEIDAGLSALAAQNAVLNGMDDRVRVVTADVAALTLAPDSADRVLMNPPFNDPRRQQSSPDAQRRLAHDAAPGLLARWASVAARLLKPDGVLTLIWRVEEAGALRAALSPFGWLTLRPVLPRPHAPPIRLLVRAGKAGTGALREYPALVLNDAHGKPSAAAEAVLRGGEALEWENGHQGAPKSENG